MEKGLTKQEEVKSLAGSMGGGLGIEGVEGFDASDLSMPWVKLVHPTSKNVELSDGKKALPGQWFHTTKKTVKDRMVVIFIHAAKDMISDSQDPDKMLEGVKIIALDIEDLESPFAMQFTKGGYWAYKKLLTTMVSWKITKPWEHTVLLDSKTVEVTNEKGIKNDFLVPTIDLSDPVSKKDLPKVAEMVERFKGRVEVAPVDEPIDPTDIPF